MCLLLIGFGVLFLIFCFYIVEIWFEMIVENLFIGVVIGVCDINVLFEMVVFGDMEGWIKG